MRDRPTHDLSGDGRGSFLSQRARLARLLGLDPAPPTPKPLREPPAQTPERRGRVLALRGRGK